MAVDPYPSSILSSLRAVRRLRGQSVTYRRGSLRVALRAIPGRSEVETADSYGAPTVHRFKDYILERADLAGTDGQQLEPRAGDSIDKETPDGTVTYQVTSPDETNPPWRAVDDSDGLWIRIHAQQIT